VSSQLSSDLCMHVNMHARTDAYTPPLPPYIYVCVCICICIYIYIYIYIYICYIFEIENNIFLEKDEWESDNVWTGPSMSRPA
jgi:hypothetical protein